MTMVAIGPTHWPTTSNALLPGLANLLIDAADEVAAFVFRVPKTGTVTRVHFRTRTVTTGATVDVRLETVNASGQPSGTLFGTSTNVSHVIADTNDNLWIRTATLTGSASVTQGDRIAVCIVNPSASFGNMNIGYGVSTTLFGTQGQAYCLSPNRTTKVASSSPVCALEYDDGTFGVPVACFPVDEDVTNRFVGSDTNPDEIAVRFQPNAKMRVIGWYATVLPAAGADYRVSLYEDGNNTPLLTEDYDGDDFGSANFSLEGIFDSTYTLAAGTVYRLGFVPLTTTDLTFRSIGVASAHPTLLDSISGTSGLYYSSRDRSGTTDPDSASWTDVNYRRLLAGLLIDQIDDGAGGGGGGGAGTGFSQWSRPAPFAPGLSH